MQLPRFEAASLTFEEMEEVNQKSKNIKADSDTLATGCGEAKCGKLKFVYLGDRPQPDFNVLGQEKMEVKQSSNFQHDSSKLKD